MIFPVGSTWYFWRMDDAGNDCGSGILVAKGVTNDAQSIGVKVTNYKFGATCVKFASAKAVGRLVSLQPQVYEGGYDFLDQLTSMFPDATDVDVAEALERLARALREPRDQSGEDDLPELLREVVRASSASQADEGTRRAVLRKALRAAWGTREVDPGTYKPGNLGVAGQVLVQAYQSGTRVVEHWCLDGKAASALPLLGKVSTFTLDYSSAAPGTAAAPTYPTWMAKAITMAWVP